MGNLRPLNQILPQQPVQQPVYQQPAPQPVQQQPAPQPYQQPASGELQISQLTDSSQLGSMANNGRVEIVIEDRNYGHLVLSSDKINIAQIEQRNVSLGQELRIFDGNRDGWIEEHELKTAAAGNAGGDKVSAGEHVASTTIGGAMFGLAVGTVARKVGWDIAGKIGSKMGVKGWIAAAGIGAAAGLAGGLLTKNSNKADAQVPNNGYGQWDQSRLAKAVL